jgi:hypothetical protein
MVAWSGARVLAATDGPAGGTCSFKDSAACFTAHGPGVLALDTSGEKKFYGRTPPRVVGLAISFYFIAF